tara:strand:- start:2279 stop:3601 length:1323 start_codon:yes stop_codon:yes gene_type:complete
MTPLFVWADPTTMDFYEREATAWASGTRSPICKSLEKLSPETASATMKEKQNACRILGEQQKHIEDNAYDFTLTLCYDYKAKKGFIPEEDIDNEQLRASQAAWMGLIKEGAMARFDEKRELRNLFEEYEWWEAGDNLGSNYMHFLTDAPGFYYGMARCLGPHGNNLSEDFALYNEFTRAVVLADIIKGGAPVSFAVWGAEFVIFGRILKGLAWVNRVTGNWAGRFVRWVGWKKPVAVTPTLGLRSDDDPVEVHETTEYQETVDNEFNEFSEELKDNKPQVSEAVLSSLLTMVKDYRGSQILEAFLEETAKPFWLQVNKEKNDPMLDLHHGDYISEKGFQILISGLEECLNVPDQLKDCTNGFIGALNQKIMRKNMSWKTHAHQHRSSYAILTRIYDCVQIDPEAKHIDNEELIAEAIELIEMIAEQSGEDLPSPAMSCPY